MKKRIRITSRRRTPPDTRLLAQALIELVLHQREQRQADGGKANKGKGVKHGPV